jgi:hypothetical protein
LLIKFADVLNNILEKIEKPGQTANPSVDDVVRAKPILVVGIGCY